MEKKMSSQSLENQVVINLDSIAMDVRKSMDKYLNNSHLQKLLYIRALRGYLHNSLGINKLGTEQLLKLYWSATHSMTWRIATTTDDYQGHYETLGVDNQLVTKDGTVKTKVIAKSTWVPNESENIDYQYISITLQAVLRYARALYNSYETFEERKKSCVSKCYEFAYKQGGRAKKSDEERRKDKAAKAVKNNDIADLLMAMDADQLSQLKSLLSR